MQQTPASPEGSKSSERPMHQAPLLDFGSDLAIRSRWFIPASFAHPAKLHLGLLAWIVERYTHPGETILDPMAGSGSVLFAATLQRNVIARDIEPTWVALLQQNAQYIAVQAGLFAGSIDVGQADAREPWTIQADHVICSPPYGCAASPTPNARRMLPYRLHALQVPYGERWQRFAEKPTAGSMGAVVFHYGTHPAQIGHLRGTRYWEAMRQVYTQAHAALRPSGFFILIVKDHIYQGQRVPTADSTVVMCQQIGFLLQVRYQRRVYPLSLWQRRRKETGLLVVEEEDILVFTRKSS